MYLQVICQRIYLELLMLITSRNYGRYNFFHKIYKTCILYGEKLNILIEFKTVIANLKTVHIERKKESKKKKNR